MQAETRLVNLTPHAVTLVTVEGERVELAASGTVARVVYDSLDESLATEWGTIRLVRGVGDRRVVGLPDPAAGTVYIVSRMVLDSVDRDDVACPTDLLRNEAGAVVGAESLELRGTKDLTLSQGEQQT